MEVDDPIPGEVPTVSQETRPIFAVRPSTISASTSSVSGQMMLEASGLKRHAERDKEEMDVESERKRKVGKTKPGSAASVPHQMHGKSKSTIWARVRNEKHAEGAFASSLESLKDFERKIFALDANAHIIDIKTVRHIKCGKALSMKCPYNTGNFKTHVKNCTGPPKSLKGLSGAGMKPINTLFQSSATSKSILPIPSRTVDPCPGLDGATYPSVFHYLDRSGALGGGANSVTVIAQDLYGKRYRKLSKKRKRQVKTAQKHDWRWQNDHSEGRIFSTECAKVSGSLKMSLACLACLSLLKLKAFKNAVAVVRPLDKNYRFNNTIYQNKKLAILYGRSTDLREVMEAPVCASVFLW